MKRVCWIFRSKKRKENSIENVFLNMEGYIGKECNIEKYFLPEERYFSIRKMVNNLKYTKRISGDVYHITGEVTFCAYVTPSKNTIITIHDFVILHNYKGLRKLLAWLFLCYLPFRKAAVLTAISKATYDEAMERFPWCKHKLVLIPDPISDMYQYSEHEFNTDKPTVLLIGANPNKNLERVIQALSGLNVAADIIGKLNEKQIQLLENNEIDYELSSNITNEEMYEHYKNCDMVCFASTYEGFGMIIVEAQAVGRPVITSNIEPMLTVAGDAAEFVDPFRIDSIRNGIKNVIENKRYRDELVEKGKINCMLYRANVISEEYCKEYAKINEK